MKLPVYLLTAALLQCTGRAGSAAPAQDVIGIWEATRNFGPALRGPLTITREDGEWRLVHDDDCLAAVP